MTKFGPMFGSMIEQYSETLVETTIHSMEIRYSKVEGMTEEISIEITKYLKDELKSGPNFNALKKRLMTKYANLGFSFKFWSQLELMFQESVSEGFSKVVSTAGKKNENKKEPKSDTKSEEVLKSMTLVEF